MHLEGGAPTAIAGGAQVHHASQPVDMARDHVAVEAIADLQGALEVQQLAQAQPPEARARQGFARQVEDQIAGRIVAA